MTLKEVREKSKGLECDINSTVLRKVLKKQMYAGEDGVDIHTAMFLNDFFGLIKKYSKNK